MRFETKRCSCNYTLDRRRLAASVGCRSTKDPRRCVENYFEDRRLADYRLRVSVEKA